MSASPFETVDVLPPAERCLDDLKFGEVWTSAPFALTEDAVASGWHLAARVMQEVSTCAPFGAASSEGMRVDDLSSLRTARVGDRVQVRRKLIEVTRSKTRPDRGTVRMAIAVMNQFGEPVLAFTHLVRIPACASARP